MQLQQDTLFDNRYTLRQLIGRGGFSEVWLAQDKYTGLDIALKIYALNGGLDSDCIETFAGEIRRVHNLNHPNLLKPQHFDVYDGMPYLVMPYCANGSVTKRAGHLSEDEIWKVLHDVAAGLAYLHEHNIVHQDIKPDNILQSADGHYLITDFGISARTRATLSKTQSMNNIGSGTAAYMAPERFSTNPAPTFASDVWALGATLYELITGSVPFGDGTLPGGLLQKNGAEMSSLPASISNSLRKVIEKSVSVNPWDRPTAVALEKGNFLTTAQECNRPTVAKTASHSTQPTIKYPKYAKIALGVLIALHAFLSVSFTALSIESYNFYMHMIRYGYFNNDIYDISNVLNDYKSEFYWTAILTVSSYIELLLFSLTCYYKKKIALYAYTLSCLVLFVIFWCVHCLESASSDSVFFDLYQVGTMTITLAVFFVKFKGTNIYSQLK